MSQVRYYYFDASTDAVSDPNAVWTNPSNAFDNDIATFADCNVVGTNASNFLFAGGTNAPAADDAPISQVRARLLAVCGLYGTDRAEIYTNALGELLGTATNPSGAQRWGNPVLLEKPAAGWTWQTLKDLEVKLYSTTTATTGFYQVEIIVTVAENLANMERRVAVGNGMSCSDSAT